MTKDKIKKHLARALLVFACVTMLTTSAFAATYYQGFNVDVPRLNGSINTSEQTKTYQGRSGHIRFDLVGGGKTVDCRMRDNKDGTEGAWLNGMKTNGKGSLASRASHAAGDKVCVRISNKLTTVVAVNCNGDLRADNP